MLDIKILIVHPPERFELFNIRGFGPIFSECLGMKAKQFVLTKLMT
jgi:hypothetical protein